MHTAFAWGFWWLNVAACLWSIIYWLPKRLPNGVPCLFGAAQPFIWQLIAAIVVLILDASPWHLLWLALVSAVLAIFSGRILVMGWKNSHYRLLERERQTGFAATRAELQRRGKTSASSEAAALLDKPTSESFLYESLGQFPSLSAKFHKAWAFKSRMNATPSRWDVSAMFNQIGIALAQEGDFDAAVACLTCSATFVPDSPLRWAAGAEIHCAGQDRVAGKWAEKVLGFQLTDQVSTEVQSRLTGALGEQLLDAERKRMKEIVEICRQHEDWRDTYPLVKGAEEAYFTPNF